MKAGKPIDITILKLGICARKAHTFAGNIGSKNNGQRKITPPIAEISVCGPQGPHPPPKKTRLYPMAVNNMPVRREYIIIFLSMVLEMFFGLGR